MGCVFDFFGKYIAGVDLAGNMENRRGSQSTKLMYLRLAKIEVFDAFCGER